MIGRAWKKKKFVIMVVTFGNSWPMSVFQESSEIRLWEKRDCVVNKPDMCALYDPKKLTWSYPNPKRLKISRNYEIKSSQLCKKLMLPHYLPRIQSGGQHCPIAFNLLWLSLVWDTGKSYFTQMSSILMWKWRRHLTVFGTARAESPV